MRPGHQAERRRSRRVRIGEPLLVRPSDPKDKHFEEISRTRNASREGIYFTTKRDSYYPGMRLFVTVPYHPESDARSSEQVGQVMRVEELGDGERGIAVLLLSSGSIKGAASLTGSRHEE